MSVTVEQMRDECVARMRVLKLHKSVIRDFINDSKLNLSENGGFLYWLDEAQQERVRNFESKYNVIVFHVIRNFVGEDEHLAYLYVSDNEEEWEYDRENLKDGFAFAYVDNLSYSPFSEFGIIGIKPSIGGLIRTC